MKCEHCGTDTDYRAEGSTEGFFCPKCNWALVTTHIPKITQDITKYSVYLTSANYKNKDHLKILAKLANINLLQARGLVQKEDSLIFKDSALAVNKARKILDRVNIKYLIKPDFPYSITGTLKN